MKSLSTQHQQVVPAYRELIHIFFPSLLLSDLLAWVEIRLIVADFIY